MQITAIFSIKILRGSFQSFKKIYKVENVLIVQNKIMKKRKDI